MSFGQGVAGTVWLEGLLMPFFTLAPNVWILGLVNALFIMMSPVFDVVQYSYRMALIPDELQGRVNSSYRLLAWGSRPLGSLAAGLLLDSVGGTWAVLLFAGVLLVGAVGSTVNKHVQGAPRIESLGEA